MRMTANAANTASQIVYPELSYKIVGISYKIQNELGRFCTEKQYAKAFGGEHIGKNWADFIVDNKVVVDLKAKSFIERNDYYQMQKYLTLKNMKLGLIINFQGKYLKPKRVLNSRYSQDS